MHTAPCCGTGDIARDPGDLAHVTGDIAYAYSDGQCLHCLGICKLKLKTVVKLKTFFY
jgi:hypothetical protein